MHAFFLLQMFVWKELNALDFILQVPFGLSIAVNIRVGQELGAGNPKAAQHVYRVAISTICKSFYTQAFYRSHFTKRNIRLSRMSNLNYRIDLC